MSWPESPKLRPYSSNEAVVLQPQQHKALTFAFTEFNSLTTTTKCTEMPFSHRLQSISEDFRKAQVKEYEDATCVAIVLYVFCMGRLARTMWTPAPTVETFFTHFTTVQYSAL